jgi:hypothetical protein
MGSTKDTGDDLDGPDNEIGPVEQAVAESIAHLDTSHPMDTALRALAMSLARSVDGANHSHKRGVAAELRATLEDLAGHSRTDDEVDLAEVLSEITPPPKPSQGEEAA